MYQKKGWVRRGISSLVKELLLNSSGSDSGGEKNRKVGREDVLLGQLSSLKVTALELNNH